MSRKPVKLNKQGIAKLPDNKPVVYKIQTGSGANNYTGIAQRGRVQERPGPGTDSRTSVWQ